MPYPVKMRERALQALRNGHTNGQEVVAPFAVKGSMDGDLFEGWLEHIFVSELKIPIKAY